MSSTASEDSRAESIDVALERKVSRAVVAALGVAVALGIACVAVPKLGARELGMALLVASVVSAAMRPWRLTRVSLWASSVLFFALLVGVTARGASAANGRRDLLPQLGNQLTDTKQVDAYLESRGVAKDTVMVKTGIFLTHMEFTSSNNVAVSGFVWQIYPPGTSKDLQKGVTFPEAVNGGYDNMQTAYEVTRPDGTQISGWHFDLTFRQKFDYAKYPFDQQDVWIRMWSRDFERGAMLVPDFEGHPPWQPSQIIGVEKQFVYSGWAPVFTGYGYLENQYTSTFGLGTYKERPPYPEMVFTTSLRRLSSGPFVNHVIPLVVIYMLTFAIILFMVKDEERSFNILSALAGLFFLTLLNHQQINTVAVADGLSFLGAASAIMYLSFFAVAANGLAVARLDLPMLEWRHNMLAKLLFLPLTALMLAFAAVKIL
jgi:hypothetical protein